MTQMNSLRHNAVRRQILKILAPEYPKTVDMAILQRVLATFGHAMDTEKLRAYLAYLEERECIRVVEKSGFDFVMVSITSTGLDVLDGRKDECGIEV